MAVQGWINYNDYENAVTNAAFAINQIRVDLFPAADSLTLAKAACEVLMDALDIEIPEEGVRRGQFG
jgi:hypothetical protein